MLSGTFKPTLALIMLFACLQVFAGRGAKYYARLAGADSVPAEKSPPVYLPAKLKANATAAANCYDINWATWSTFDNVSTTTGSITDADGTPISITMSANYLFGSTPSIYTFSKFSGYPSAIPNTTVPKTTWAVGPGGATTMCFSRKVTNPVLLLSSLGGSLPISARLDFSIPYVVLYDGGGMVYNSSTAITGTEGYAIIMFPGDFTCVTINSSTPENYTNITWGIRPQPFAVNITDKSVDCSSVTVTASGGLTYKWNSGDTPNQATNTFRQSGTYLVTVTNASGCVTSASKTITINPAANAIISGTATGCGPVTLTASGGSSYLWSGGNSPTAATNTFISSGTYTVTVTSASGCSSTASALVTVNPAPMVTLPQSISVTNHVAVTAQPTTTGNITNYLWSPAAGLSDATARNPLINPANDTDYTLTVTTADGCTASAVITATLAYSDIEIPNTFTPNGDGVNDTWNIKNLNTFLDSKISIFTRWGQRVYYSIGYPKPWDGTYKGKRLAAGVYYYVVDVKQISTKQAGWVTIIY